MAKSTVKTIFQNIGKGAANLEKSHPIWGQVQRGIRNTVAPILRNFVSPQTVGQYQGFSQPNTAGLAGEGARMAGSQIPYLPLMLATSGITNPITSKIASLIPKGGSIATKALSDAVQGAIKFAPFGWMGGLNYAKTPQERLGNIGQSTLRNMELGAMTMPFVGAMGEETQPQVYNRNRIGQFSSSGKVPFTPAQRTVFRDVNQKLGRSENTPASYEDLKKVSAAVPVSFSSNRQDDAVSSPGFVNGTPDWVKSYIQKASEKHNIPTVLLSALLKQESGFNPKAVSQVGAQGIAQFMPATAQGMGVNPYDPESAIMGAAKYLRQAWDRFGKPELALAAYNSGGGNVSKFGGIPPFKETQNYVKNIMAMAGEPHQSANGPLLETINQIKKDSQKAYNPPTSSTSQQPSRQIISTNMSSGMPEIGVPSIRRA